MSCGNNMQPVTIDPTCDYKGWNMLRKAGRALIVEFISSLSSQSLRILDISMRSFIRRSKMQWVRCGRRIWG